MSRVPLTEAVHRRDRTRGCKRGSAILGALAVSIPADGTPAIGGENCCYDAFKKYWFILEQDFCPGGEGIPAPLTDCLAKDPGASSRSSPTLECTDDLHGIVYPWPGADCSPGSHPRRPGEKGGSYDPIKVETYCYDGKRGFAFTYGTQGFCPPGRDGISSYEYAVKFEIEAKPRGRSGYSSQRIRAYWEGTALTSWTTVY